MNNRYRDNDSNSGGGSDSSDCDSSIEEVASTLSPSARRRNQLPEWKHRICLESLLSFGGYQAYKDLLKEVKDEGGLSKAQIARQLRNSRDWCQRQRDSNPKLFKTTCEQYGLDSSSALKESPKKVASVSKSKTPKKKNTKMAPSRTVEEDNEEGK